MWRYYVDIEPTHVQKVLSLVKDFDEKPHEREALVPKRNFVDWVIENNENRQALMLYVNTC